MSTHIMQISDAEVRLGPKPASGTVLDAAAIAALTDFKCQVTAATIEASSNSTPSAVAATFCGPASEVQVPVASTFTLNMGILQDWDLPGSVTASVSRFLFLNDAKEIGFALYLKGNADPVATGVVIAQAGSFGGTPGEPLVATLTLPIQGYPNITDATGTPIRADNDPLNVTKMHPLVTGTDAADLPTLKASGTIGDGSYTGAAFTTGQYVILGNNTKASYKSGAWVAGAKTP